MACNRQLSLPDDERPTVDAREVVWGFCSLKCYRLAECGLDPGGDACIDPCVEDGLAALSADPCWTEWIEVRRCGVRWASCETVDDETIPASAEQQCAPKVERLTTCEAQ